MKNKLFAAMLLLLTLSSAASAADGFKVGFWFDAPKDSSGFDVKGVALGIPIIANKRTQGADLSIFGGATKTMNGFQGSFVFNTADRLRGCQLSIVNFINKGIEGKGPGFQVGLYNQSKQNGFQLGFINNCEDNANFQFGLICINKNGWLPFMVFVNFAKETFK